MTEISEKEVRAAADVLLGRVNAPEQEIYRAARDALEAAAIARAEANAGEPVAWAYELANFYTEDRGYYDFELQISKVDPRKTWEIAPDRIRNIRPLYTHPAPQPSGPVEALDEDDYEEIISAAAINIRKATSGIRGQVVTVQDSLDWWVMKETERRILSALTSSKPEQSTWKPIETAPADGRVILVYEARSAYPIHLRSADGDWWRRQGVGPSHWMPLPTAPTAGGEDA